MIIIYSIFVKIDDKSKQNFYDNCPGFLKYFKKLGPTALVG